MPKTTDETRSGLLRVSLAAVLWGTIPVFARMAPVDATVKVFWRCGFAAIALLAYMAATGRLGELRRLPRRRLAALVVQGALLTLNWVLFLGAIDRTEVAVAELLAYTGPVLVAALAPFVTRERFDRRIVLPLALSLGGTAIILLPHAAGFGRHGLLGPAMAFASAFTYAVLILRSKRLLAGVSNETLMVVEYLTATVLLSWAVLASPPLAETRAWGGLLALGLIDTALAGLIFLSGLRRVRTDHAATLTYAEPVSAVLFAAAFLGEALTANALLGGALVLSAGVLVSRLVPSGGIETPEELATEDVR